MEVKMLISEIIERLNTLELTPINVDIKGVDRENSLIDEIYIQVDYPKSELNVAEKIKDLIENVSQEYEIKITRIYMQL